jgi:predicted nucleic acid-binding Zn ribbon protein
MSTREEELGTYEMLWDCGACGTRKLLGVTHRHCPACGSPQEAAKRYFPSDEEKVAVADHPFTGVDRVCAACQTPSALAAVHCPSCGAPLDEGKDAAQRHAERVAEGQSFGESRGAAPAAPRAVAAPAAPAPKGGGAIKVVAVLAVIALAAMFFLRKKPAELTVVAHHWRLERPVEVQELVERSAWRDEVPLGAPGVVCHEEARSTKRVPDGETCERVRKDLGNGAFKEVRECAPKYREEPVMGERCTYRAPAWRVARMDRAEGQGLATPRRFAATAGALRAGSCIGCEREGATDEILEVEVRAANGTSSRCRLDEARWSALKDGHSVQGEVRAVGGGVVCDSLR